MYSIIKSGMASAMHELSVISNNISNANSNGFKKSLVSFADFAGGIFPASVQSSANGLGSMIEETRISDAQGAILSTENKTDMALLGNGFFALQNLSDNSLSFTRNGAFGLDEQGFLTTADNHRVLGTPIFEDEFGQIAGNIEALLPIQIPSVRDDLVMSELQISPDGRISARYGEEEPVPIRAPRDPGFADLQIGGLEISNVNITEELTAMIKAQQQFNGSARLMQANSDMVEKLTR
jgi:flagellar hook protein FlgE